MLTVEHATGLLTGARLFVTQHKFVSTSTNSYDVQTYVKKNQQKCLIVSEN